MVNNPAARALGRSALVEQRAKLLADPPKPFPKELFAAAKPDPEVALQSDVGARHDQRALVGANALGDVEAW